MTTLPTAICDSEMSAAAILSRRCFVSIQESLTALFTYSIVELDVVDVDDDNANNSSVNLIQCWRLIGMGDWGRY